MLERMRDRTWGGRCHPHRRKHCIAATLQIAVLPVISATRFRIDNRQREYTVDVHTAEVGRITSYSTGPVGRERHYRRCEDKDKSEKDDET
jgi:hypothetical protein